VGGLLTVWRVAAIAAALLAGGLVVFELAAPPIPHGIIERTAP